MPEINRKRKLYSIVIMILKKNFNDNFPVLWKHNFIIFIALSNDRNDSSYLNQFTNGFVLDQTPMEIKMNSYFKFIRNNHIGET